MGLPPGRTNNPRGRPRTGLALAEMIQKKMAESPDKSKRTYLETWIQILFLHAFGRADELEKHGMATSPVLQAKAWQMLADHGFQKPVQSIEVSQGIQDYTDKELANAEKALIERVRNNGASGDNQGTGAPGDIPEGEVKS